ncbi:MAG: hypothetical protein JXO22_16535, partial [Phycisphaerae bacterium]|nr:hypothetical protein [Phycisphaerae bacterium]
MPNDEHEPNGQRDPGGEGPRPPVRMSRGVFSWIVVIGVALMLLLMLNRSMNPPKITITQFEMHLLNGEVDTIVAKDRVVTGKFRTAPKDGDPEQLAFEVNFPVTDNFQEFLAWVKERTPKGKTPPEISFEPDNNLLMSVLIGMLPWLLVFGVIWFFLLRQLRQSGGGAGMLGNFGRSRHRIMTKEHTSVTFADVAGVEEAKEEVTEIIEFLRNPK